MEGKDSQGFRHLLTTRLSGAAMNKGALEICNTSSTLSTISPGRLRAKTSWALFLGALSSPSTPFDPDERLFESVLLVSGSQRVCC